MAERRMFAKTIIDSDAFLDMPLSAQALYFHLSMRADDEGFINNPKKIQRMVGASEDDLKLLLMKNFLISFDTGVVVIKHWKIHNYIQSDRFKKTVYTEERALLKEKENHAYTLCIQNGYKPDTQDRLEIGKSKDKTIYSLPLKNGTEYEVSETYVEELKAAYPGKDLDNEFNRMRAWLISNPSKQKTGRGIKRFINGWLSRETKTMKVDDYEEVKPDWMTDEWLEDHYRSFDADN